MLWKVTNSAPDVSDRVGEFRQMGFQANIILDCYIFLIEKNHLDQLNIVLLHQRGDLLKLNIMVGYEEILWACLFSFPSVEIVVNCRNFHAVNSYTSYSVLHFLPPNLLHFTTIISRPFYIVDPPKPHIQNILVSSDFGRQNQPDIYLLRLTLSRTSPNILLLNSRMLQESYELEHLNDGWGEEFRLHSYLVGQYNEQMRDKAGGWHHEAEMLAEQNELIRTIKERLNLKL